MFTEDFRELQSIVTLPAHLGGWTPKLQTPCVGIMRGAFCGWEFLKSQIGLNSKP